MFSLPAKLDGWGKKLEAQNGTATPQTNQDSSSLTWVLLMIWGRRGASKNATRSCRPRVCKGVPWKIGGNS